MSIRNLWRRLFHETEDHDDYARLEEAQIRAEQTGDERAERTKYRLLLEAEAKQRIASNMRGSGMDQEAERYEQEAVRLRERVACIGVERDEERSKEAELLEGVFGTRRRGADGRW